MWLKTIQCSCKPTIQTWCKILKVKLHCCPDHLLDTQPGSRKAALTLRAEQSKVYPYFVSTHNRSI